MSQPTKKQSKQFNEYECGNGPRPPVPGEESQTSKMTTEGASNSTSSSNSNRSPDSENSFLVRVKKWQESFTCLLADNEGVELLLKFVEEEAGIASINYTRLKLYFAIEGLKLHREEKIIRKLIRKISDEIIRDQIEISPELRTTITSIVQKKIPPNTNVFDDLQKQVKDKIASTSYQTFLTSEFFIRYVEEQEKKSEAKPIQVTATSLASAMTNAVASGGTDGGAASFSGMTIELSPLLMSSNLQTLHEDTELNLSEEPTLTKTKTYRPKLTENLLRETQLGRLEVRPPGAYMCGYMYDVSFNSSFNPVSRQDSERQSCSSASLTDSEVNSKDGKPYFHRRSTGAEDVRRYMNPQIASHKTAVRPLVQGLKGSVDPVSNSKLAEAKKKLDPNELCEKLNELLKKQEKGGKEERFTRDLNDKLSTAKPRELPPSEDDDQAILDDHVKRVFSPYLSPGTISPKHFQRYHHHHHHRSNEMSTSTPDFAMRHSKSIPEHASTGLLPGSKNKLVHKWPSINIDSGISLCSFDTQYKTMEMKSTEQLPNETMRKSSKDDLRRTRKPLPLPPSHQSSLMPTSSSHHTNSLPRIHEEEKNYTFAVYTFGDEKIPFRTKIPGKRLTLKNFKDYLMKKGNFRFFFTTVCDDPDNPVIQEEVINDMDVLPLYDGKIMCTLKSVN